MGPRYQDPDQGQQSVLKIQQCVPGADSYTVGLITSLLLVGAFFGQPASGYLADKYGRRKAIIFGCCVFILGGTIQTAAQNIDMMMAGRVRVFQRAESRQAHRCLMISSSLASVSVTWPCWLLFIRVKSPSQQYEVVLQHYSSLCSESELWLLVG
jgi:MFS family permease